MSEFRYRTREEYEVEAERQIILSNGDDGPAIDFEEYEKLLDEYVKFCEVTKSGTRLI